jgi:hypothetical protein
VAAIPCDKGLLVECCLNTSNREALVYLEGLNDLGLRNLGFNVPGAHEGRRTRIARQRAIHIKEVGG